MKVFPVVFRPAAQLCQLQPGTLPVVQTFSHPGNIMAFPAFSAVQPLLKRKPPREMNAV